MEHLKIAVLLSGSGTTLANLLDCSKRGDLAGDIDLVVSSSPGAKGLEIARAAGVRTEVVESKKFKLAAREGEMIRDWPAMSRELDKVLINAGVDLICMAGYLCRYLFHSRFKGRVLNIHPSLIPMFSGEGMYGHRVHEAVVASGVRVTGCTVHYADHTYDTGPIILQRCCPVYADDCPDDVAARVFREECVAYPTAINLVAQGRVRQIPERRTSVVGDRALERFSK